MTHTDELTLKERLLVRRLREVAATDVDRTLTASQVESAAAALGASVEAARRPEVLDALGPVRVVPDYRVEDQLQSDDAPYRDVLPAAAARTALETRLRRPVSSLLDREVYEVASQPEIRGFFTEAMRGGLTADPKVRLAAANLLAKTYGMFVERIVQEERRSAAVDEADDAAVRARLVEVRERLAAAREIVALTSGGASEGIVPTFADESVSDDRTET